MAEQLEERVALLEAEIQQLKLKMESNSINTVDAVRASVNELDPRSSAQPWWEQIAGSFADDPVYDAAMQLGRDYRDSLQPNRQTTSDE
ncbi:MAG: hypothetical protein AB4042_13965 [Leptolyngbyaceae cyanobacterium]